MLFKLENAGEQQKEWRERMPVCTLAVSRIEQQVQTPTTHPNSSLTRKYGLEIHPIHCRPLPIFYPIQ